MRRWLYLSLVVNAMLLAALCWQRSHPPRMPRTPRGAISLGAGSAANRTPRPPQRGASPATPWGALDTDDPGKFMAALRAAGCPEATIRDLTVMKVCRRYQRLLLESQMEREMSWTPVRNRDNKDWRDDNRVRSEMRNQMREELEALLGQSYWVVATAVLGWPDTVPPEYLPLEKRQGVRAVQERYRQLTEELSNRRAAQGVDAEDAVQLARMEAAQRAELKELLSPADFEEYLMRESPASRYVREKLPPAKSEAEFRAMVKVADELGMDPAASSGFPPQFGLAPVDPVQAAADAQREAAFQARLKELLGEERVADQQAEEAARQATERKAEAERNEQLERERLTQLASEAGIEPAAATRFMDRLKELQPAFEAKFKDLEAGLSGTGEERARQMKGAVRAELERIAAEMLGEKGKAFVDKFSAQDNEP